MFVDKKIVLEAAGVGKHGPVRLLYAAIDVGSNNVRMDLYGEDADGRLVKVDITEQNVFPCKLAQGMTHEAPVIKRKNMQLAVEAMRAFDAILTTYNINPENTCTVMTAAIRDVQYTEQGKQDIAELVTAFNNRKFTILTEQEEAILDGEAVKLVCPTGWRNHRGKKCKLAYAAIGGGSLQAGSISEEGEIEDAAGLPLGLLRLKEKSGNNIPKAGKILAHALRKQVPTQPHKILALTGGYWRGLGVALCKQHKLPTALHGKNIRSALISATHRKEKHFLALADHLKNGAKKRIRDRAKELPMSAAMAWRVAKHFGVKKVIFLDTTIRDALVHQMHALNTGRVTTPSRGLERLFVPSAPAPAPRA